MPIAYGNGQLFLAWEASDESLYVASSTDGKVFSNKHKLEEKSLKSTRPSLTFGNGKLYLAWLDPNDHINIISSPDGLFWSNKRTITETAHRKAPPAIAFMKDRLYLAWTGRDHKNHINVTSFSIGDDGELAEFGKLILDEESSDDAGPSLVATDTTLYLVWQGRDNHVNIVQSTNGKDFQGKETLKEQTDHASTPGIAYGDGVFYLSWIGKDEHLNVLTSTDGSNWGNKLTVKNDRSTSTGVAGVAYGKDQLFLDWSGTDHKHHINVMSFGVAAHDGVLADGTKVTLEDEEEK